MSRTWCLRLFAVCVGLISLARIGAAQNKVAVLNVQRAVLESADIQKASAALEAKYKPRAQEIEKLAAGRSKYPTAIAGGPGQAVDASRSRLYVTGPGA